MFLDQAMVLELCLPIWVTGMIVTDLSVTD